MTSGTPPLSLEHHLTTHFGFTDFNPGQREAIHQSLAGHDVVVVMPTGSGKSLCFQLTAMILPGVTLVISPLIALMKDQVDTLQARNLPATFINSSLSYSEMSDRLAGARNGKYKLVYIAPERFRNRSFQTEFNQIDVSLVAIDEAHCISQWGHDFRPDYLRLKSVLTRMPDSRIMALTATATPDVRADIVTQLGLGRQTRCEPVVTVHGFARTNLHLAVTRCSTHTAKLKRIQTILRDYPTGIIYCSTRKQTERVHSLLTQNGQACGLYHGGMTDDERKIAQDAFINGDLPVVAATNAFGMGVDRGDLRTVIHWDIPGSVEAYYQEVGRAGRDGKPAWCELLFNYADVRTQEFFLDGANPTRQQVEAVWKTVRRSTQHGPITKTMKEWTELVDGIKNDMTTGTIMAMLERSGLIQRQREAGGRSYTTDIVLDADDSVLHDQYQRLAEKRQRDETKIKTMLKYVDTRGCRHAYILHYFGDPQESAGCAACDRCVQQTNDFAREPSEEEWEVVQKILSCVARMKGQFGVARVVQVLKGSRAKPVLEWDLDSLPTHGLLSHHTEAYVRTVLEELISDGSVAISQGEFPLVDITERGRDVIWQKVTPSLTFPSAAGPTRKKPSPSSDGTGARSNPTPDSTLLHRLKAWRMKTAKSKGVPAYTVLQNKSLEAIAETRPQDLVALETLYGMGPARITKYGEALLELVNADTTSEDDQDL